MSLSLRLLCPLTIMIAAVGVSSLAHSTTPEEMKVAVESAFTVTTRKMTGGVKAPGTVLVVQQDGIRIGKLSLIMRPAVIEGGKLTSVGGGGGILDGNAGVTLKKGDRVHLYAIKNTAKNVGFIIGTVATFQVVENGNTKSMPFVTGVGFNYDAGLETVSTEAVMKDISAWFKSEAESAQAGTKSLSLGQSPAEVIEIMGAPEKKIELGPKAIYTYKDLKVTFMDGKVSDVE